MTAPIDEQLIEISLNKNSEYQPGEVLIAEYQISREANVAKNAELEIEAIEASVLWTTTGKGEEDIGVHFFERKKSLPQQSYFDSLKLTTVLPSTPLSYSGRIINVEWLVRVKVFFPDGASVTKDEPFKLGAGCYFDEVVQGDSEKEGPASEVGGKSGS